MTTWLPDDCLLILDKIRFDNSYSWTRGKTLLYLVELFTNDEVNDLHVDKDAGGSWTRFVDNKQITHL